MLQLANFDTQVYGGHVREYGNVRTYGRNLGTGHLEHIEHLTNMTWLFFEAQSSRILLIAASLWSTSTSPGTPHHNMSFFREYRFFGRAWHFFLCFEISHIFFGGGGPGINDGWKARLNQTMTFPDIS